MYQTVFEMFAAQVAARPDALAVQGEDRALTFSQLERMAAAIQSLLPAKVQRVGIIMDHGVEMIAAILGVLRAGAAYVPVEPSFPDARIRFMMQDCQADCILAHAEYAHRFDGIGSVPIVAIEHGFEAKAATDAVAPVLVQPSDLAYVLYTSGSTGRPKGIAIEQRNVCHYARAFHHEFQNGPGDVMLQHSVCTFDIFVEEVFATLLNGAALAIPTPETRNSVEELMAFIERLGVTMVSGFPYLLMEMNDLATIPASLRLLISGGDVLRTSYVANLVDKVAVYNTYGPSETTVCSNYFRCTPGSELADGTYPIGHAVLGATVRILDGSLQPVPTGTVGEICIGGDGVGRGYIGHANMHATSFAERPDGTRLYRSGDLGYELPNGDIAFVHRKDNQVMVWGQRVEPDGVQSVLCECAGVKTGVVRAYPDERGMASYLTAYYVADGDVSEGQIRVQMAAELPAFMVPELFVRLERMPLTANGKVDVEALPKVERSGNAGKAKKETER
ncbi:MAG: amino acid adenylation domain-containing protein [bacterium]|nr:amino acid adenylation domain-containing protein [bacterium]